MQRTEYTWDHRNRSVQVTEYDSDNVVVRGIGYSYDAANQLISRTEAYYDGSNEKSIFIHQDGQIVLQFHEEALGSIQVGDLAAEDLSRRFLWGPAVDQLLADEDVNSLTNAALNDVLWPLTDHLGTVRDWIDSSGALLDHAQYDAFGGRLDAATVDAAFEWTGRYRDPLTGLQWNQNRWYNPDIQRWMSEDPIGFAGGDANLSRYVTNSPTQYIDPTGLWFEWIVSPVRSFREWRRGVELDRHLDELDTRRAQKEMALCPGSDQGEKTLHGVQQRQRDRAVDDATGLSNFNYQISGIGFSGGFIRPGAGGGTPKGGRYKDVRRGNVGGHVHHTPASAVSPYPHVEGPSIWMEPADHCQTASWGRSAGAHAYRRQQQVLIDQGRLTEAIQMDIDDIRSKFGSKYDEHIREMLEQIGFSE